MAKIRKDYEQSWWPRFLRWLHGESAPLDQALTRTLTDEDTVHTFPTDAEIVRREDEMDTRIRQAREAEKRVAAWGSTKGKRMARSLYSLMAVVLCLSVIYLLINTTAYLPSFGNPGNPMNNVVSQRYIEKGMKETGAVNIVAGMILDYRAFDTLGESNVLFIAACSVLILLRISQGAEPKGATLPVERLNDEAMDRMYEPKNDMILQKVAQFLVPLIMLMGLYIMLNGHLSPGGGFSGGAVMGAGLILYLTAFGFRMTERFFTFTTFRVVSVMALSFYALSKTYSFFTGANHLPSIISTGIPGQIFSAGLIPYLNLAVGLVVTCTMYAFYTLFRKGDM